MAALVDRINSGLAQLRHRDQSLSINDWAEYFTFAGNTYPVVQTTMGTVDREQVGFTSVSAFTGSGPIFSLVLARLQVFSQVRFQWTRFSGSQPTELFGTPELAVLERPWPGGTTSDLLARMEVHASVAGCAYVTRPKRDRLSLLRPDRVIIIMGSETDAEDPSEAPDAEIIGFVHQTSRGKMTFFDPDQVAYYCPIPDPDYRFLGISWIRPVIRELQADSLATEHKARFFCNAATPNLAIKFDASIAIEKVKQFKELLESEHKGAFNAWKTLYLGGGADPVTVGNSFRDMDYAAIQGRAESRLASTAGVPPSWVGFAEGLSGSSLNEGNFKAGRRRFSDGTMIHLWTSAATSLEVLLSRPAGAALWYDPRVPFMREDAGDLANIQHQQAQTIVALVRDGFTSESAVAAVTKNDFSLLVHSGMTSVQLQRPGTDLAAGEQVPKDPAAKAARSKDPVDEWDDDPIGELDDDTLALLQAMDEIEQEEAEAVGRAWNPALHARYPKGHPKAGKFRPMVDLLKLAIANHDGKGDPFKNFNREQLRKAAKARGITLKRGEDRDSIVEKLLADLGGDKKTGAPKKEAQPKAPAKHAKPAKKPSTVADVKAGDFSGLKRVGPSAGTTPGGVFEGPDGFRWYVKAQQSPQHAKNEALASALYRAAGVDVPEVVRGKGTPGLSGDSHTATRMVDGAQTNLAFRLSDDAYMAEIRKGFALDAWLANWDVVGEGSENPWGNIVEGGNGKPWRIDVGGALLFRGKGGEKGDRFGPQVVEFDSMRDISKGRRHSQVFSDMTDAQVKESVDRVKAITPAKIRKLVGDHGMDPELADLLIARRKDLLSRASGKAKVAKGWDGAATGEQALDGAPVRISGSTFETSELLEKLGLDAKTARRAVNGFAGYQDGMYTLMNTTLLKAGGGDLRTVGFLGLDDGEIAQVEAMDKALKVSRLTKDVIVFRGERAPARNFAPGTWSLTGGMEGMEWTWHPFGSSSADMDVAQNFAVGPTSAPKDQAQPTVMRILVRKGTPAVHLQGTLETEQELLLGRSLKYRVVKDYGVEDGIVRRIDVEVVPA